MLGDWHEQVHSDDYWVPVPGDPASRAYRTGDFVQMRGDGNWMFHGRRDNMVKVWGYRVELGEIEACLLSFKGIEQSAVVKITKTDSVGVELVAFVVPTAEAATGSVDVKDVYKYCRQQLPNYMVPDHIHKIDEMPLNHSGKIDRLELTRLVTERD